MCKLGLSLVLESGTRSLDSLSNSSERAGILTLPLKSMEGTLTTKPIVKALFQSAVLVAVFAISYALGAHPVLVGVLSGWSWVAAGWLGGCIADRCDRA